MRSYLKLAYGAVAHQLVRECRASAVLQVGLSCETIGSIHRKII